MNRAELRQTILSAACANHIPAAGAGLWTIKKFRLAKAFQRRSPGAESIIPAGEYTQLFRYTESHAMREHELGELVMQDTPDELQTHLEFMMRAWGKVLVTGMGLGCVVRGTLANPAVTSVTLIERDSHVMQLVSRFIRQPGGPEKPLHMILCDASDWVKGTNEKFDCAWHDLWSDPDKEEQHLQVTHTHLIASLASRVKMQGAWKLPRWFKRRQSSGRGQLFL